MSRHKKSRLECYIALIHRSFRLSIHSGKSEPEFLSIHRHICRLRSFPFFHPLRHCHLYCSSSAPPILHLSSHYQYCILAQKSILRLWIPACTSGQSCIAASSHSTSDCLPALHPRSYRQNCLCRKFLPCCSLPNTQALRSFSGCIFLMSICSGCRK